jgi:hypothetical protein
MDRHQDLRRQVHHPTSYHHHILSCSCLSSQPKR